MTPTTQQGTALDEAGFALYVHWPFCLSKCPYCDFNSHVAAEIDQGAYRDALLREMDALAEMTGPRTLASIFFGGGTPSLMAPQTTAAIIEHALQLWRAAPGDELEITLEANPTSAESAAFHGFAEAGVNRLSLGIQALDGDALEFLGRKHSAGEALKALDLARDMFSRVNADMIYARPGQSRDSWRDELNRLLDTGAPGHLSLYQLTIERGTPFFAAHRRGDFVLPDDEDAVRLYAMTGDILDRAGLYPYEISNYARAGEECRHNLSYWRYRDYGGIGPGAHGRFLKNGTKTATENWRGPDQWLENVNKTGSGLRLETALDAEQCLEEMVMMGLRLEEGVNAPAFEAMTGKTFAEAFDPDVLARLESGGFLFVETDALRATAKGRMGLDAVLGALLS